MPASQFLTLLVGVTVYLHASAWGQDRRFDVSVAPTLEDRHPTPPTVFSNGVTMWRDKVYQALPGYRPQLMDIYVPKAAGPHPLIVYVHGGAWLGGDKRRSAALVDFPQVLASLAAEGFIVASIQYRLSGEARFPAQLQDVNAAIRFLRRDAKRYRIDPEKVGIWGGSAGGHLAALAALTCRNTELDSAAYGDRCIKAAVTWYGIFDFAAMRTAADGDVAGRRLLGCESICPDDRIRAVSPVNYMNGSAPPFLLIHGTKDQTVPAEQSRIAEGALRKAKAPVSTLYLPDVDHSFIGATPQVTRAATAKAIEATFDFFHHQMNVPNTGVRRP